MLHRRLAPVLVALSACVPTADGPPPHRTAVGAPEVEESSPLARAFLSAAEEHAVPADLLKALAYVETRFEPARGEVEFDGQLPPWGLFALRGAALERAAALSGQAPERVRGEDAAHVRAAAALLGAMADAAGLRGERRTDPLAWGPVLERWGEVEPEMGQAFARQVLEALASGLAIPLPDGTTLLVARHGAAPEGGVATRGAGLDAAFALWRPSPNHGARSRRPELVVIHTCEGSYAGCVSWLRNSSSGVSAHYVVNESGSEISQLVAEDRKAWHVSASYRSRLNDGQLGHLDGEATNNLSIGIEHGGSARQSSFPEGQIDASVRLVRDITARHGIPRDRYHVVAHGRLQPENRVDPGPNWPWSSYLAAINAGDQPPVEEPPAEEPPAEEPPPTAPELVTVDNETTGRFRASAAWDVSSWASGRVGADYRYHSPGSSADAAGYRVHLAAGASYEVYARVPGNGYNADVPYLIHHRGGTTTVRRDLRAQGGRWISLGTYDFDAGDEWRVEISAATSARGFIIADAVRLERRGVSPPPPPPPPAQQIWQPRPGTSWQWQLSGTLDTSLDVQMYDLDLFDTSEAAIAALQARGKKVVCYFSAGSHEDWRSDQASFPAAAIGAQLDEWPGERWLDVRHPEVRARMKARLDLAAQKGCDGVEPDNVDGYANSSGFALTAADQLDYNRFLAREAHARGLSIGLKNDLDQAASLVGDFDWALNEQCFEYQECDALSVFVAAGKAVFQVEYGDQSTANRVCPDAVARELDTLVKRLELGAERISCR